MADKQRRFTDDFKRQAVRLVDSRQGIGRTARNPGISKSSLTRWMPDIREKDLLPGPHDRTRMTMCKKSWPVGAGKTRFGERSVTS
jgi:transposase-like protein